MTGWIAACRQFEMPVLELRPHHGLCLLHFVGKGYSDAFTAHMTDTLATLCENPQIPVRLRSGADHLCAVCPHRRETVCESAKPARYDAAVLHYSGLQTGQTLFWKHFRAKMEWLSKWHLQEICGDCRWYPLCAELEKARE